MAKINDVILLLNAAKKVAIISHTRPDGDTIGGATALRLALTKKGVAADLYCDGAIPKKYSVLEGANSFCPQFKNRDYDLAVAIDTAAIDRLGRLAADFKRFKNTLCIDHHKSNANFCKHNLILPAAASTSEIVFDVIKGLGVVPDTAIAACVYTGIVTDTGGFLQANTTADTFCAAAELLRTGLDFSKLAFSVYKSTPLNKFRLDLRVLNKIKFYKDNKIAVLTFTLDDFKQTASDETHTEGTITRALDIEGVSVAIAVTETEKSGFKISMRSRGAVDVCDVCMGFGGGGHKNASGCNINGYYEDVLEKIIKAVSDRLPD
jgi:phosphoesterase RecJ-like protein